MKKLSTRLSKKVMGETAAELHRYFLDDPFKDMLPTESLLIPDITTVEKVVPASDAEDTHEHLFVTVTILGTITLTISCAVCACVLCPRASYFLCLRVCPGVCSASCEVVTDGCQRMFSKNSSGARNHMLNMPPGAEGQGLLI